MTTVRDALLRPAAPAVRDEAGLLAAFATRERARFEARLAEVTRGLAPELVWLEAETARAVGLRGHPGRRWRPLLALAAAEAAAGDAARALDVACAVELTHTASLVLDDLPCMDDAATRRGQDATHRMVGTAGAILVAVGMLGRAVELLGRDAAGARLAHAWGEAVGFEGMVGGQVVDVALRGAARGRARRLHRQKTTALAELAAWGGAVAAGAEPRVEMALRRFGRDLGWAYQLADDADDLAEDGAMGQAASGLRPRRQSRWIRARAERHLRERAGLAPRGVALMVALARDIVPGTEPGGAH